MVIVGRVEGAECKRDENKGQWPHKVYFSYLLKAALSNDLGKENLFDASATCSKPSCTFLYSLLFCI